MAYPYGYTGYTPQYQQQYPQQPMQTPMQQQVQSPQHIVRPVASVEEARAVQTDFSGALTIMPDTAHGYIYTKQLNLQTGCADFAAYSRVQMQKARFNTLCDKLGGSEA